MLGKLLKYELKSTSRLMGVLYLAVLIVAAIVGFLARGTIWQATQGNAIECNCSCSQRPDLYTIDHDTDDRDGCYDPSAIL